MLNTGGGGGERGQDGQGRGGRGGVGRRVELGRCSGNLAGVVAALMREEALFGYLGGRSLDPQTPRQTVRRTPSRYHQLPSATVGVLRDN